jgi:hypothetical protein
MAISKSSEKGIPEVHPFIEQFGLEESLNRLGWDEARRDAWVDDVIVAIGVETLVKAMGPKKVLEVVGNEQGSDRAGVVSVIGYFVEKYGIEGFVALLSEKQRQHLRELCR